MPADAPNRGAKSLHDTIRDDLEHRILSGIWPPGHKVPSELDLSEDYGCSRMTVNKVMTQLAAAGLILRRRRVGSVVLPQKSQNAVLEIHNVKEEVLARGGWYHHDVVALEVQPEAHGTLVLDLETQGAALRIETMHYSDETPFCFEDRLIFLDAVPQAETETFETTPPGAWLLSHVPWSAAEHEIAAASAEGALADRLGIPPSAPCLTVSRRTWKNGLPVTSVRFSYPGTMHSLRARFTPSQA